MSSIFNFSFSFCVGFPKQLFCQANIFLCIIQIIAHKSTTQEIIALRQVFDSIDTSHNGTVDYEEFREGLKRSRFSDEELTEIFESIVSLRYTSSV